ncbi:MAG: helix-turn-helix domain-containing protein [Rothia sp. (in: high G+C Gram-positive bacteria)]|nr:helix-turn-helix domain-containing protein [Rothia sp. (in: high G+C Gram-positive bacteria)]
MALSRPIIVDTAFRLLTRYGLADLSMRRLAQELDVAPGALYYHVKNKQDLLAALACKLLTGIKFVGTTPGSRLEAGCQELYRHLIQINEAADVIRIGLALIPEELEFIHVASSLFAELCLISREQELAAATLLHTCISLIEQEQIRALFNTHLKPTQPQQSYFLAIQASINGWEKRAANS